MTTPTDPPDPNAHTAAQQAVQDALLARCVLFSTRMEAYMANPHPSSADTTTLLRSMAVAVEALCRLVVGNLDAPLADDGSSDLPKPKPGAH